MAPRKPKAKGGALTRAQRTRSLRKRPGYGGIQLVPGGIVITCRKVDGFVNLAEIFAAEADMRGGKPKELRRWLALQSTPGYLEAIAEAEGLDRQNLPHNLIERGGGSSDPWAHHEVACEIAAWLSPELRLAINRLWMETVNGKKRPKADPLLTNQRRATQRPFTDVLAAKGMDGAGIQRCQRQLVFEVTGKAPNVWRAELGPNWMDLMPEEFQVTMAIARRFAAEQCEQLDLSEAEGFFRHFNAAFRRAAAPVKQLQPYLAEIAANCDAAKALMLGKTNP
jgi:hypothetical protein